MAWLLLVVAGMLETCWAVGMKYSHGFTRLYPSLFTLATMAGSVGLLALAVKTLPLGTAYAVWTGIGAIGAVLSGIVLFGDSASPARLLCIVLIFSGIVGLRILK